MVDAAPFTPSKDIWVIAGSSRPLNTTFYWPSTLEYLDPTAFIVEPRDFYGNALQCDPTKYTARANVTYFHSKEYSAVLTCNAANQLVCTFPPTLAVGQAKIWFKHQQWTTSMSRTLPVVVCHNDSICQAAGDGNARCTSDHLCECSDTWAGPLCKYHGEIRMALPFKQSTVFISGMRTLIHWDLNATAPQVSDIEHSQVDVRISLPSGQTSAKLSYIDPLLHQIACAGKLSAPPTNVTIIQHSVTSIRFTGVLEQVRRLVKCHVSLSVPATVDKPTQTTLSYRAYHPDTKAVAEASVPCQLLPQANASLSDTLSTLRIDLNMLPEGVSPGGSAPCARFFTQDTLALVAPTVCRFLALPQTPAVRELGMLKKYVLEATLGAASRVLPGQMISPQWGNISLPMDTQGQSLMLRVNAPADPVQPVAIITGPESLPVNTSLRLSGSLSASHGGHGGRALNYTWALYDKATPLVNLLSSKPQVASQLDLVLQASDLTPGHRYRVTLQVVNFLGVNSAKAVHHLTVMMGLVPQLTVRGGFSQSISAHEPLTLFAHVKQSIPPRAVQYKWTQSNGTALPSHLLTDRWLGFPELVLPSYSLRVGEEYRFTAFARFAEAPYNQSNASASVLVRVKQDPVVARILGGSRTVAFASALRLDGSRSLNPSCPAQQLGGCLQYTWTCLNGSTIVPWSRFASPIVSNRSVLEIPASGFPAPGVFKFVLRVQSSIASSLTSDAAVEIELLAPSPLHFPAPAITLRAPSSAIPAGGRAVLHGSCGELPSASCQHTYLWYSVLSEHATEQLNFTQEGVLLGGSPQAPSIAINSDVLTSGAAYTVHLTCHLVCSTQETTRASAALDFSVAEAPVTTSLEVSPRGGDAFEQFTLTAGSSAMNPADLPLLYRFSAKATGQSSFVPLGLGWAPESTLAAYLPLGNLTLRASVKTQRGAVASFDRAGVHVALSAARLAAMKNDSLAVVQQLIEEQVKPVLQIGDRKSVTQLVSNIAEALNQAYAGATTMDAKGTQARTLLMQQINAVGLASEQLSTVHALSQLTGTSGAVDSETKGNVLGLVSQALQNSMDVITTSQAQDDDQSARQEMDNNAASLYFQAIAGVLNGMASSANATGSGEAAADQPLAQQAVGLLHNLTAVCGSVQAPGEAPMQFASTSIAVESRTGYAASFENEPIRPVPLAQPSNATAPAIEVRFPSEFLSQAVGEEKPITLSVITTTLSPFSLNVSGAFIDTRFNRVGITKTSRMISELLQVSFLENQQEVPIHDLPASQAIQLDIPISPSVQLNHALNETAYLLFWNETTSEWQEDGCVVVSRTILADGTMRLKANCTHLTWFAAFSGYLDPEPSSAGSQAIIVAFSLLFVFLGSAGVLIALVVRHRYVQNGTAKSQSPEDIPMTDLTAVEEGKLTEDTITMPVVVSSEPLQQLSHPAEEALPSRPTSLATASTPATHPPNKDIELQPMVAAPQLPPPPPPHFTLPLPLPLPLPVPVTPAADFEQDSRVSPPELPAEPEDRRDERTLAELMRASVTEQAQHEKTTLTDLMRAVLTQEEPAHGDIPTTTLQDEEQPRDVPPVAVEAVFV
eukprot:gnl/Trimastix_PCT/2123.p1 GENE.gnl/Trimastix_PCT/2123~~gnl/Trimastix_PCT/2123.p1  ORF type:complete len:1681 (+),score=375.69 gnl/Trimastix_PCT/2123:306-5045(+)